MTKHIPQNIIIAVTAILVLGLAVLLVLELIPPEKQALEVKQVIEVSSSPVNREGLQYVNQVRGMLYNSGNDPVKVEQLRIIVQCEGERREVLVEGMELLPRYEWEIEKTVESVKEYQKVIRVEAVIGGETVQLSNAADEGLIRTPVVIVAVLLAAAVVGLVIASKKRYYMYQEDKEDLK